MKHPFAATRIATAIYLVLTAANTIHGQTAQSSVPDSIAFVALYHVVHDAPPPHWDRQTRMGWLRDRGMDWRGAEEVIKTATRYMQQHAEIEASLHRLNQASANSLDSTTQQQRQAIEATRLRELAAAKEQLRVALGAEQSQKLELLIDEVRKGVRLKTGGAQ